MRSGRSNKPAKTAKEAPVQSVPGTGDVFTDLDIRSPDLALATAELVQRIRDIITERKLTQARAAALLGLDEPKVSALVRGRVEGYSLDRLFRFLNALGQEIAISLRASNFHKTTSQRPRISSPIDHLL